MVATSTVLATNSRVKKEQHQGAVCVFLGATSGIGLSTLEKLSDMLSESTFYILGRNPSRFSSHLDQLRNIGPSNTYEFIEAQISLLSDIDTAAREILSVEKKVDYVCMSSGGMPWSGKNLTKEGLDTNFAMSYYSRLRLVSNLLPLLHQSPQPRILSILNGTKEKEMNEEDLNLDKSWGLMAMINQSTMFTSLAFDYLATQDEQKHLTLVHCTPGLVNTGQEKQKPTVEHGWIQYIILSILRSLAQLIVPYVGMSMDEAGDRHAYLLTTDTIQPGSWRVDKSSEVKPDVEILVNYQQRGWAEKVWEYTQIMWEKALAAAS